MRMISLGTMAYGAYKAYQRYRTTSPPATSRIARGRTL